MSSKSKNKDMFKTSWHSEKPYQELPSLPPASIDLESNYYRLLLEITKKGAWEDWIIFILQGVEETSFWITNKIKAIKDLMQHTIEYVQKRVPKIYSYN